MPDPKTITFFLPTLSARKPPTKLDVIRATLVTAPNTPIRTAKASFVPARLLIRKGTGEADTIELAKVVKKIMANKRTKLRDA
jgi:hypothetical protein